MTLEECIEYLENIAAEKKPRGRKARCIIKYLQELKNERVTAMTTDKDLLPCPFCGGTASTWMGIDKDHHICLWGVVCDNGDCSLRQEYGYKTKEEAIEAWNRRTGDDGIRSD